MTIPDLQHNTPYVGLAPYACFPEGRDAARLHAAGDSSDNPDNRNAFQKDYSRLLYADAIQRLKGKTQVFTMHESDHVHDRLTHSLKVADLAASVCRELGLNPDLAKTIALAHDMGHTPFGHAGEKALDEAMKEYGGFDHNAHTIRILTEIESDYSPEFSGLNLSWAALEGIAKHDGIVKNPPRALAEYNEKHDLELDKYASAEAQIAALCDDITYLSHDLFDSMRVGLITEKDIERKLPDIWEIFNGLRKENPDASDNATARETSSILIGKMVADLIKTTQHNLQQSAVGSVDNVRNLSKPVAGFSAEMKEYMDKIRGFSKKFIYENPIVTNANNYAKKIVKILFENYMKSPQKMEDKWHKKVEQVSTTDEKAIIVADYIAGMTDKFAVLSYDRLTREYYHGEPVVLPKGGGSNSVAREGGYGR